MQITKNIEESISKVKRIFSDELSERLNLIKVEAPLIVEKGTGINDDLNGTERPVSVSIKDLSNKQVEIVHSLAKWKRFKLSQMGVEENRGLYTDMRALRPDEDLSDVHSVYVDQWDWEQVIGKENRTLETLKNTVKEIYDSIRHTEMQVEMYYGIERILPKEINFIHTEDLIESYPTLTPKERENEITKQYGAVFLIGIGGELIGGEPHDGRAPDYDDWSTPTSTKYKGLNGDILVWNPVLNRAFEISSMGIRVDENTLDKQLTISKQDQRRNLAWHKDLLEGKLPQSIGGGIGQSRLCMFLLRKQHIGEVQSGLWSDEIRENALSKGINLL
jgi:aspartate--ammonia ligase